MYRDEKSTSLGHIGRAETQSLPNIALPAALPEIQVSPNIFFYTWTGYIESCVVYAYVKKQT